MGPPGRARAGRLGVSSDATVTHGALVVGSRYDLSLHKGLGLPGGAVDERCTTIRTDWFRAGRHVGMAVRATVSAEVRRCRDQ
jgi:hypothetical protein